MSAPLIVSIPHSLGREEAMRRLKTGLSCAAAHVPILKVEVTLPFLLQRFAEIAQAAIRERGKLLLTKK